MSVVKTNTCVVAPHLLHRSWPNSTTITDINNVLVTRNIAPVSLLGSVMILGIICNSVMIHIFAWKYKQSNYRTCSLWLAAMDICGSVTVVPFFIHLFLFEIDYPNDIVCKMGITMAAIFLFACHMMLLVIAIERYIKVYHPFRRQLSTANMNFLFIFCYLIAFAFASPHAIFAGWRTVDTGIRGITARLCFVSNTYSVSFWPGKYYTAINVLSIAMSLAMILMYARIVAVINRFKNFFKRNQGYPDSDDNPPLFSNTTRTLEVRRTTYTLIAATISFIITTFPFTILAMVAMYAQYPVLCNVGFNMAIAFRVIACSVLLNTVANPIIYGFADKQFRKELKGMCCRK